ncbi:lipopolysaccharide biosynthesis protein [Neobittarella massiliensis]|nr:oligosaccharide flippase family protein [Neobittarella massiliensis]
MTRIFEKYRQMSAPVKAAMWFTICSFLQKGIQFITVPIFTRLLTKEQYGLYNVYNSWSQIVLIFASLNLFYGVFNNGMLKFETDRDRFVSSVQGASTAITTALLTVYLCTASFWNRIFELPTVLVLVMFVQILFFPAIQYWSARQRYEFKYRKLVALTLTMAIADPLLGIIAVLNSEDKATAKIISAVLVQVAAGLVLYIYNAAKGRCFFSKKYWKFALTFNIPLIPHYLSQTVLNNSDRIIIRQLCGEGPAGIYSVAYSAAMVLLVLNGSINNSLIPWTYKKLKDEAYTGIKRVSNAVLLLIAGMNLILIAFAPEAISILAPRSYHGAIWVIPPVAASVFFMFLYNLFGNVEFYFEENKFIMIASVLGAVLNIILNYIFVPLCGYIAAGYTTLFCYIVYSLSHYIFMKKVVRQHIGDMQIYDTKFVFVLSILFLGITAVLTMTYQAVWLRYGCIVVMLTAAFIKRKEISQQMTLFLKRGEK